MRDSLIYEILETRELSIAGERGYFQTESRWAETFPYAGAAAAIAFITYLLTFGVVSKPIDARWLYQAESQADVLLGTSSAARLTCIAEHPLYLIVGRPLYLVGRYTLGLLPEPYGPNLALVFPGVVFGALSVGLAVLLFSSLGLNRRAVASFALLYATASATWMLSVFPETFSLTLLGTAAFMVMMVGGLEDRGRLWTVALVHALACFTSVHLVALLVIPVVHLLARHGWRQGLVRAAEYYFALCLMWALPYLLFLSVVDTQGALPSETAPAWSGGFLFSVPINFFVLSIVGPWAPSSAYSSPDLAWVRQTHVASWPLIAGFVTVIAAMATARVRLVATRAWEAWGPGVGLFLAGYLAYVVAFAPRQSFVLSSTMLLPWLFWLAGRWKGWIGRPGWATPALVALAVAVGIHNAVHLTTLAVS